MSFVSSITQGGLKLKGQLLMTPIQSPFMATGPERPDTVQPPGLARGPSYLIRALLNYRKSVASRSDSLRRPSVLEELSLTPTETHVDG